MSRSGGRSTSLRECRGPWPRPVFKAKRAITDLEHAAIVARETNPERRDFYELLWHTGASQSDAACLTAEDINWKTRTISYSRKKLKSRAGNGIKPALIRFGDEVATILERRPQASPLFDAQAIAHVPCVNSLINGLNRHKLDKKVAEFSGQVPPIRAALIYAGGPVVAPFRR